MISTPPRMTIQQSMARISSLYRASAPIPPTNHSDFFNTHACLQQVSLDSEPAGRTFPALATFAYSAFACFRMGMPGSSMRTLIGNDRIGNNDFNFAVVVASDRLSRRYYLPGPTRSLMGGTFTVSQVNA